MIGLIVSTLFTLEDDPIVSKLETMNYRGPTLHMDYKLNQNIDYKFEKYYKYFIFSIKKERNTELIKLIEVLENAKFSSIDIDNTECKVEKPEFDLMKSESDAYINYSYHFNDSILNVMYYHKILKTAIKLLNMEYKFKINDEVTLNSIDGVYSIIDYVYLSYKNYKPLYSIHKIIKKQKDIILYDNDENIQLESELKLSTSYMRNEKLKKIIKI